MLISRAMLIAVGMALALHSVHGAAADFIRLVETNPPPPPVAPEMSPRSAKYNGIYEVLAAAGPWFNKTMVDSAMNKQFDSELKTGLAQAQTLGQKGVLMQIQMLTQTTEAGPFYSLRGSGASLIGVGPNADAICYSKKCYSQMDIPLQPGQSLADGSGYVFITRQGNEYQVSRYRKELLEARAQQMHLSTQSAKVYEATIRSEGVSGYAGKLAESIRDRDEKQAVLKLLKDRDDALKKADALEAQLAKEMRRAERAARTSETLNAIAGAFQLASAINMASASMGEDVTKAVPGGITDKQGLTNAVDAIRNAAGSDVQSIRVQQGTLRNSITGWEQQILDIGIKYKMTPEPGTVFNPYP